MTIKLGITCIFHNFTSITWYLRVRLEHKVIMDTNPWLFKHTRSFITCSMYHFWEPTCEEGIGQEFAFNNSICFIGVDWHQRMWVEATGFPGYIIGQKDFSFLHHMSILSHKLNISFCYIRALCPPCHSVRQAPLFARNFAIWWTMKRNSNFLAYSAVLV